jgi:hypothetical protein
MYARVGLKVGGRMKHQKEWYTCDRCGAEIEKPKIWYDRMFPYLRTVNLKRPMCFKEISAEIEQGRIEPVISRDGIDSIILDEYYCTKTKQIDLCPKCRKDFEEFMRNDC